MGRLAGKIAVITQAGSSFGRAIAAGYAREGASLYLQDWPERADRLHENVKTIETIDDQQIVASVCDIASGASMEQMTEDVLAKFGRVDILMNTAMEGGHGILFDIREAEWDICIDRGLKSYFMTCQYLGEEMARNGYGKIINLTSIVGDLGSGGAVPWGACRGGVNSLTFAVAQALGEYGVRCVALARGATDATPFSEEARQERLRRIPFGRLGGEEDTVGPAIFLATAESDWINGSVVYADGGYVHAAATDREHRAVEIPLVRRGTKSQISSRQRDTLDTDTP